MNGRATVRDVARMAGVSVATVSRVVNRSSYISPETEVRVLEAIAQTGYVPDSIARSLKMTATFTIGFLVSDISNKYFMQMARAIEDVVSARGYNIIVCSTEGDRHREAAYLRTLSGRKIDGLILNTTGLNDEDIVKLSRIIPTLLLHRRIHAPGFVGDLLDSANAHGSALLTRALIEHGHRSIGLLGGPLRLSSGRERYEGFRSALFEAGISHSPDLFFEGDFTLESGYRGAETLMTLPSPPTALAVMNNEMTVGALRYLKLHGIAVPSAVSVAGYGNIDHRELLFVRPVLVDQDPWKLGERAAAMILERIGEPSLENREIVCESPLIEGDTIASPRVNSVDGTTERTLH